MPAFKSKTREREDDRDRKNRRSRWLKKSDVGSRRDPLEPIAKKALPGEIGGPRFYSGYLLDFRTRYRETSGKACGERADGQKNNRDPAPGSKGYWCARMFHHDHLQIRDAGRCPKLGIVRTPS